MKLANLKKQATSFLDQYKQQSPTTYAAAQQAVGGLLILDGFIGIDNPLGGKKRSGIFGTLVGVIIGIIFIFMPVLINNFTGVGNMTETTTATIASVDRKTSSTTNSDGSQSTSTICTVVANYTVAGKEYTQPSPISSSGSCSLSAGMTAEISYNPANPAQWTSDKASIGMISNVFVIIGVVLLIASFITFLIRLLSIIFGWKLLKSGRQLAKTLPEGADLSMVINEVRNGFKTSLFGFPASTPSHAAATPPVAAQGQPVPVVQQPVVPQSSAPVPSAPQIQPTTTAQEQTGADSTVGR